MRQERDPCKLHPHLVPMNRGILVTEYATLTKKADGSLPTYEEIRAVYDKYYADE